MLHLGAPPPDALRIAGRASRHRVYQTAANQLATSVHNPVIVAGQSTADSCLPPLVIHALQLGAHRQPNIGLLRELSRIYSDRTRNRMDWVVAGLPTLAMVVLGIAIGFLTFSLLLPLISLITSLS